MKASAIDAVTVPVFDVDPAWPKPLPNRWIVGAVVGVAVDRRDNVWMVHRPSTLQPNETRSGWRPAPPVLAFDASGEVIAAWGGPGTGYNWPELEHGIWVDARDRVWLGAGGAADAHLLLFTADGDFIRQIGRPGACGGSGDTATLGAPALAVVDESSGDVYVADGYVNHRVIVLDAETAAYRRHWGAYGRPPDDEYFTRMGERLPGPFAGAVQHENRPSLYDPAGPPPEQFRIVHAVRLSADGAVYVCDRTNNRLQVFRPSGEFVREAFIARETYGSGSVWDLAFSHDLQQTWLYVTDGTNQCVHILRRETLEVVGGFGRAGHWAGQFYGAHSVAANRRGDLFIGETYEGKRLQRFVRVRS
jgi:hypothetical protein